MRVTDTKIKSLIHQSNLIEGYDDPGMDAQGFLAWQYLSELPPDQLTHGDIEKVQRIVVMTQEDLRPHWRGQYRKIDVWVGNHKGLAPRSIVPAMAKWIERVQHHYYAPMDAHIAFEKIHPFVDGNGRTGRTGRLLLWWHQQNIGEPPVRIRYSERAKYYELFK